MPFIVPTATSETVEENEVRDEETPTPQPSIEEPAETAEPTETTEPAETPAKGLKPEKNTEEGEAKEKTEQEKRMFVFLPIIWR
jgi:hypothetical protein